MKKAHAKMAGSSSSSAIANVRDLPASNTLALSRVRRDSSSLGCTSLIELPLNIERDIHIPRVKHGSSSEFRLRSQKGHAMEMDECDLAKPLLGFAVATGQLGYSLDGSSECAEEALLSSFSRKRARLASLLAASNECAARREVPFRPPRPDETGGKALKNKLPIQCGPNLSFHALDSLSATSAESYSVNKNDAAQAGFLASDLYGLMDNELSSSSSSTLSSSDRNHHRKSISIHPNHTEGLYDDSVPDHRFLSYISYIASEKAAKDKAVTEKSVLLRRFDKSGLIALGVLVEELARDMILTWTQKGHPLTACTKRSISTALDLQIQGMSAVPRMRSNDSSTETGLSANDIDSVDDNNAVVNELKRTLKSMLSVMFIAKDKCSPEISQVIENLVENLDPSIFTKVSPKNIVSSYNIDSKRTSDVPILKSKLISNPKVLAQVHTDIEYRVCKYCSMVIEGRSNFSFTLEMYTAMKKTTIEII